MGIFSPVEESSEGCQRLALMLHETYLLILKKCRPQILSRTCRNTVDIKGIATRVAHSKVKSRKVVVITKFIFRFSYIVCSLLSSPYY